MVMIKRGSTYWPIYRSFVIFALFAFFVERVSYLPSYGGYVRIVVGIAIALLFAHFSIKSMNRYLAKKQTEDQLQEVETRKLITYETAVKKISNCVCPSCDEQFGHPRHTNTVDFCVHCGFCLFDTSKNCGERENAFYKFYDKCGVPGSAAST